MAEKEIIISEAALAGGMGAEEFVFPDDEDSQKILAGFEFSIFW